MNNIIFPKNSFSPRKKYKKVKEIVGFDTETEKGKCFLLGYYSKDSGIYLIESWKDIIKYLVRKKFRDTVNFFYNLDYDFQAIIKHLPIKCLKDLAKYNKCSYNGAMITYLPRKNFKISYNNVTISFFDLAQFYNFNSLNNSAIKFLNMKKEDLQDEGIDIKNLSINKYKTNPKYKYYLNKYLFRDIEITKKLGDKLYRLIEPYIIPKSFYSQASFSQQYFLEQLKNKMNLPSKKILNFALQAYQGGRFEVIKKGFFGKGYCQDIKSAYPYHNIQVPDLSKGIWKEEQKYRSDSLISLYNIDTNIYDINVSPLKYQLKNNLMIYPIGQYKNIYVNKKEIELLQKLGYKYKIKKAYHYFDKEPNYPYLFLEDFYNLKEQYKKDGKKELSWIPKIIINGFYGKTIQLVENLQFTKKFRGENNLYDVILHENEYIYVYKKFKAGNLFNPIVANEITTNTRVQLFESSLKYLDNIIGFQTDSVLSNKKLNLNYGSKLGQWELENKGKIIMLGSGVYQIISNKKDKVRLRGFSKNLDLYKILNDNINNNQIKISMLRNFKLKRAIKSKLKDKEKLNRFNVLKNEIKTININFDKKRLWDREFVNAQDVLNNQINSKPLQI